MHHSILATAALATCIFASAATHAQTPGVSFLLGSPASAANADRSISLSAESRWVNVMYGETVRFTAGDREFAWRFDGPGGRAFDLRELAPAGMVLQPVTVYVTRRTLSR